MLEEQLGNVLLLLKHNHFLELKTGTACPGFHTGFFVGEGKKISRKVTHVNT